MGGTSYSSVSRSAYTESVASLSTDDVFTQNRKRSVHKDMDARNVTIREARDSDAHPKSFPVIIALDVTASMGHIPENIVKEELTYIVGDFVKAGYNDLAVMFLAIGDQKYDQEPIQIGQFESGDEELQKWLSSMWLERGGGGDQKESYALAWKVASSLTVTDHWEKRQGKGVLISIGDEGFHEDVRWSDWGGDSREILKSAQEKWEVYHIHANHGSYRDDQRVLGQWKDAMGENLRVVESDKEITSTIIELVGFHVGVDAKSEPVKGASTQEGNDGSQGSDFDNADVI